MPSRRKRTNEIRRTAPVHITWKLLRTYKATYRSNKGEEITIRSVRKPPKTRVFRSALGRRKYKLVKLLTAKREVIIVAKTKNRKKAVDQDEIEEIEALEELEEELDDEDEEDVEDADVVDEDDEDDEDEDEEDEDDEEEPEDEDEDDEDDEDEEPAPKRSRKSKKGKAKKSKSRAAADGKVGTQEVAEAAGIDGRALRMLLRKHQISPDPDSGRYQWKSLNHPQVQKILKLVAKGEHKKAQREQLDKVRSKKNKKDASTKSTKSSKSDKTKSTKTKSGKKKRSKS